MATKEMQAEFLFKRGYDDAIDSYTGTNNEPVIDFRGLRPVLRVMDGVTPGGVILKPENVQLKTPIVTSPSNNAVDIVTSPILTVSTDPVLNGDSVVATQWQVSLNYNFTSMILDSNWDYTDLYSTDLDARSITLDSNVLHFVRVRHLMDSGLMSDWSEVSRFTTTPTVVSNIYDLVTASDGATGDDFGYSVDVSGDGNTMVVGAYLDDNAGSNSGSAYVFEYSLGSWQQKTILIPPGTVANTRIGSEVAISGDGTVIVIAAPRMNSYTGSVFIYTKVGSTWTLQKTITAFDGSSSDYFGQAVALNETGSTVVVSAYYDDDDGYNTGSLYVFNRSGNDWTQAAKLTVLDPEPNDNLGYSLAMSNDSSTIVAGSTRKGINGNYIGAAYVFQKVSSVWSQVQKLVASDGVAADYFGFSVALSGNGNRIVVGATGTDDRGSNSGSAYIFDKTGNSWNQTTKIITEPSTSSDQLGKRVAISLDGNKILLTSPNGVIDGVKIGAGYIYQLNINWNLVDTVYAEDGLGGDSLGEMGASMSDSGDVIALGTYRRNGYIGAVYTFRG